MTRRETPEEANVRKAKGAAQEALGKLIGDDDACARAEAPPPERAGKGTGGETGSGRDTARGGHRPRG